MTMYSLRLQLTTAILATLLLSSCVGGRLEANDDTAQEAVPDRTSTGDVAGSNRKAVRTLGSDTYEISVKSLASDGEFLELVLGISVEDPQDAISITFLDGIWAAPGGKHAPSELRIIDFDNAEVLLAGANDDAYAVTNLNENTSTERELTAYFPAPTSDRVTLMMPVLGVMSDIEVAKKSGTFSPPDGVDSLDTYSFDRCSLQRFEMPYESETLVRIDSTSVVISIPSDILFEFGSAELTPTAIASIQAAETNIRQYSAGGKLTVVGHTDDQGDDSINDPLSTARANAVAGVLNDRLGDGFSFEAKGNGSRDPAVSGSSTEARAANRRVEVVFEYVAEIPESESTVVLPAAPPLVATGNDPITLEIGENRALEVRAEKAERVSGLVVSSFRVTSTGSKTTIAMPAFSPSTAWFNVGRGYDRYGGLTGAATATILTSRAQVFPIDYQTPLSSLRSDDDSEIQNNWRVLADRNLGHSLEMGTSLVATVIWPDPGTEVMSVEVPGVWRITDIPIESEAGR